MSTKKNGKTGPKESEAAKLRRIAEYYDRQTDEESAREIETAPGAESVTLIEVPNELLPQVRKLIAKHKKSA